MEGLQVLFKIRDSKTGLYSLGGNPPRWNKQDKVWKTAGQLASHLSMFRVDGIPSTWEVVHLVTEQVARQPVDEFVRGRKVLAAEERSEKAITGTDPRQRSLYAD
jgi:hypothetical protein